MPKKTNHYWGARTHEPATQEPVDPLVRLGFAVVKRAAIELKEKDYLVALDALLFWLSDDAPGWLTMLELCEPDDNSYFDKLIRSCTNGKRTAGRPAAERTGQVG